METFNARPYRVGDADAINALYRDVTGRVRTREQFAWQWLEAPAGAGEMWVIDAVAANGGTRIVGHHGLMPLVFSQGAQDFVAGKTENTMVHPDYRRKILYPRYEKRFLGDYSGRFDLLFSTVGPAAALRQRKALGYDATRHWVRHEWALRSGAMAALGAVIAGSDGRAARSAKYRLAEQALGLGARALGVSPRRRTGDGARLTALDGVEAAAHPFFETFWTEARAEYPMTPRRMRADLDWRFWRNPYQLPITLILDGRTGPRGYAIVNRYHKLAWRLADIVCLPVDANTFSILLGAVADWCAGQGGYVLNFLAADDPGAPARFTAECGLTNLSNHWPVTRLPRPTPYPMLRRLTDRGAVAGGQVDNWYVTPLVFEGRS